MVLTIEDEELLKRWLKGEITMLSNSADPIHLSDYVVSMIKQSNNNKNNNNNNKTMEQTKSFYKGNYILIKKVKIIIDIDIIII